MNYMAYGNMASNSLVHCCFDNRDESLNKDDYIDLVEAFGLLNKYMLEKPNKAGTITLVPNK